MKITIEATSIKELQEALQHLAGKEIPGEAAPQDITPAEISFPAARVQPVESTPVVQPVQTTPVQAAPGPVVQPVQTTPVQTTPTVATTPVTYQLDDLARAGVMLMNSGKQAQLQQLLADFGVQSLPELPGTQYGAFATALRSMGAQI